MAKNTGLAALFDRSYRTGDPQLDALFGLTDRPEEDLPPLRAPERREIPRGAPREGRASTGLGGPATPFDDYIAEGAIKRGLDPNLVKAFMGVESANNPKALSNKGAMGLMQVMPGTFQQYGSGDPKDPYANLDAGMNYLSHLNKLYKGDISLMAAGYNAGEGAVAKYGNKIPPFSETQKYVPKVLDRYNQYSQAQAAQRQSQQPEDALARDAGFKPHIVGAGLSKSPISKVDPRLQEILTVAAQNSPYDVQFKSGYREGDTRQHGKHNAIDVQLVDKRTGKALADYQDPRHFRDYEQFAQTARAVQEQMYPELADNFRWGGYFSGKKNYGALDLMHFDIGGGKGLGMLGGSWEGGLNEGQRALWQGVQSQGMGQGYSPQLASTQAPQAQPQESPFYPVRLSDGQVFDVEKGMGLDEVHAMLKQNKINAVPLRPYKAPDGNEYDVEYDMTDDEIQRMLKGGPAAGESNYLGAVKHGAQQAFGGIAQGAGTEIGELGKAIAPYSPTVGGYLQEKGPQLHAYGEQLGKDIEGQYKRPEGLGWVEENITYPAAETAGQMIPYLGAGALSAVPGVGQVLGPAAVIGATHAGVMGGGEQEAKAAGKEFVPSEYRPYAAAADVANLAGIGAFNKALKVFGQEAILGSREAIKAAVEKGGIEAAKKEVGSRLANIAAQTGWAEAGLIGGEVVEDAINRAYLGKPLLDEGAKEQYLETAKQVGPLGLFTGPVAGLGARYNKATEVARLEEQADVAEKLRAQEETRQKAEELATVGVTPEQLQKFGARNELEGLSEVELLEAYKADLAEKEAAKAAKYAELPEELRDLPYREAKRYQEMMAEQEAGVPSEESITPVEEPVAPAEPVSVAPPPTPEIAPEAVQAAPEVEEPIIRGKGPGEAYYDTLGLKRPKTNLAYNALKQFDINNPAHAGSINAILDEIEKKGMPRNQAAINAVRAKTQEVQDASQIESAKPFDAGHSKLPEGGEEIGRAPVSGEGIRASDQEGKGIAGEGQEEGPIIKEVRGEAPRSEARIKKEKFDALYDRYVRSDEKVEAGIGRIDPDAFLKATTSAAEEARIREDLEKHGLPDFNQRTPIELTIDEQGNIVDHEGRHRMMVLRDKGYKQVPVIIKRRSSSDVPLQKSLMPQRTGGNRGRYEAFVYGLEPIHYDNRAKLEEQFVERPQIKETKGENKGEFDVSKPDIREAKIANPDAGVRAVKPEDYSDIADTRQLVQRFKEKGTDPELLKLMNTINASPHLGSIPVRWVKEGDKVHPEIAQKFRDGAAAMAAWDDKTGPTLYFKANDPNLREDVLAHEAVHAVTEAAIRRNPEAAKALSRLTKQIGYSLSEAAGFQHDAKKDKLRDFWRRVVKDDPGEMLAYGLTSPSFREALKQYAADGRPLKAYRTEEQLAALRKGQEKPEKVFTAQAPKELTLWDKFVDAVAKLFGLPTKRKDEFKRQLNEYLDKKAQYEQKVKDYNTLRPLQERLDTVFKDFLRETSKKGVDFEMGAIKEVKAEAKGPTEAELKEAEDRLKASGLVGAAKDRTMGTRFKDLINDIFTEGRNTSFVSEWIDVYQPISKAVQDLPDTVGKTLRSDYVWGAYEQRGNVIQESYRKGFVTMGRDGTLETVADSQLALAEIFKRVGAEKSALFNNVLVALRVRSIRAKDVETRAQANKLLNMADEMEDYASTLKDTAKRKKFNASARNLRKIGEKKLENINWEKGRTSFTEQEVKDAETVLAGHPELVNEAENVYALLRKQPDLWEKAGIIDKAKADEWREYPNYFPLYKTEDFDDHVIKPSDYIDTYADMMGRGPKRVAEVKKQKWHDHEVFVENNLLRHITFFASAAAEHSARKNTAYHLELLGKAERIKAGSEGKRDLVVKFRENGKDVFYRIDDAPSYYAMQTALPLMSPLLKRMRQAGNFGRGVMIKNPLFWFRQAFREPLQASLVGRAGFISTFDTLDTVSKIAAGKSEGYKRLKAKGVIGPVDIIPDPVEFIKVAQNGKGMVAKGMDAINHVHEAMDAATRTVVYEKAKADALSKGFDEETADAIGIMKAREIINFAKQGRSKMIRAMRATTPFFGAALNSLDVMARAASPRAIGHLSKAEAMEARRNFYANAMMITAFSTAYAALMSEDEDYLKEPDRIGNWLIPVGDHKFIKIPIPFEAGWFTKELPELTMLLNMGAINVKEAITEGKKGAAANILPPMPTAYVLQPFIEVAFDHDIFTGTSIEGRDSDVMVRDRNSKASEMTKAIVNKMEDMGVNVLNVSANQLEHLARKFLGQMWAVTRTASDAYINRGKVTPAKEWNEYPLISGAVTSGAKDRAVNEFYTVAKNVSQVYQSKQEAAKRGDKERFDQIINDPENQAAIRASDRMKEIKSRIGEISTSIEKVKKQALSEEEMTSRVKVLKERQTILAKKGVEIARKLGLDI